MHIYLYLYIFLTIVFLYVYVLMVFLLTAFCITWSCVCYFYFFFILYSSCCFLLCFFHLFIFTREHVLCSLPHRWLNLHAVFADANAHKCASLLIRNVRSLQKLQAEFSLTVESEAPGLHTHFWRKSFQEILQKQEFRLCFSNRNSKV